MKRGELSEIKVYEIKKVPYASIIESLIYVIVCTRPDIAYASYIRLASRQLSNFNREYWQVVK